MRSLAAVAIQRPHLASRNNASQRLTGNSGMVDELKPTPRYWRVLRTSWTVGCVVVAVALIALWVRSYWCRVSIQASVLPSRTFQCSFLPGRIHLRSCSLVTAADRTEWITGVWQIYKNTPDLEFGDWDYPGSPTFKFSLAEFRAGEVIIHFPYWSAIFGMACMILVAWVPRSQNFSLRTLMLVTTLVGVLLGFVVWASR